MSEKLTGITVTAIRTHFVVTAMRGLAEYLSPEDTQRLKINSGEHLAAILMTAVLGRTPVGVEPAGGPDLVFAPVEEDAEPAVVIEIKSLPGSVPGGIRKFQADLGRSDDEEAEPVFTTEVVGINDVVQTYAMPQITKAAEQLSKKVPPATELDFKVVKQVFIVAHVLDHMPKEGLETFGIMAQTLDPLPDLGEIDDVWLLFAPDRLMRWSVGAAKWQNYIFGEWADDGINEWDLFEDYDHELTFLQNVEWEYLRLIGREGGSPFLFHLNYDRE
ncbi:hypothetical protein ACFWV1_05920 [Streptomyces sp. NPDC058700]|uniref:hypothetical protein n=1 Tax=Streptomyces sp. NPDC058700 TaxID=3346607 RepID=UPI003656BE3F